MSSGKGLGERLCSSEIGNYLPKVLAAVALIHNAKAAITFVTEIGRCLPVFV